jgi:hypothetical protein
VAVALGEQENGTARLAAAVVASGAALEEYKHDQMPLDWAMTQNNLGNTLWRLGEREKRIWKRRSQPFARRSRNTGTLVGPCGTDVTISRSGRSATRLRSIRAMSTGTIRAETFWCGRAEQGRPCRGSLRFDRGHLLTANSLCWAYYFLCRYNEVVETADRSPPRPRKQRPIDYPFVSCGRVRRDVTIGMPRANAIIMFLSFFLKHGLSPDNSVHKKRATIFSKGRKSPDSLNTAVFALGRRN